ncbi:25544_t:CDS:1, partial [Gigaspora margarita]
FTDIASNILIKYREQLPLILAIIAFRSIQASFIILLSRIINNYPFELSQ